MGTVQPKANTMFRFSLIVCVSLIYGITAKPYKPRIKLTHEAVQDTVMSINDKGKMSWEVQVEPPEDMDKIDFDIDPRMMLWKNLMHSRQDVQHLKPEEDLDKLHHPSMADIQLQVQKLGGPPAPQAEPWMEEANMKVYREPVQDRDHIDHPVFSKVASEELGKETVDEQPARLVAASKADAEQHLLDHMVPQEREVRVHLYPEEDMDHLYHKAPPQPIPFEFAVAGDVPSPRRHSEPEENLDHLFHQ